ncbi:MAG TPA: metallophosphoesterase [Xanthobacteraceae bacterium]|nr:metallophosphoesterase [Xanthobacteraceae bacterium]
MGLTYAFADLHGRHDMLLKALDAIEAHAGARRAKIVALGDYVDRGPDSRAILDTLMAGPRRAGDALVCIKGNHEDIMSICLRDPAQLPWWIANGGWQTLLSYGYQDSDTLRPLKQPLSAHLDWIDALPLTHADEHRLFVHAAVHPDRPLDDQMSEWLLWGLYAADDGRGHGGRHVVHGHHQFVDGPRIYEGRINLDTFAWLTGRLVVGVFDDGRAGGPVDLIEVVGEPHPMRDRLEAAAAAKAAAAAGR